MANAKFWLALAAVLLLLGCAGNAGKMGDLRMGIDRAGVVAVMGEPDSTAENDGVLYMRYYLSASGLFSEEYFVRLTNGQVDAYGKRGDFGLGY